MGAAEELEEAIELGLQAGVEGADAQGGCELNDADGAA